MKKYRIIDFVGTCASEEIGQLAERPGRWFSWKKAKQLIKEYSPELYNSLALDLRNPWDYATNIKHFKYLHIIHSAVDYIFQIEYENN